MTAAGVRVLVVDDNEAARQLICMNLELEGFEIFTAVDGLDCLEKVGRVQPALITLNIMMPRMDGWETASRLRAHSATADIKVVIVSARAQDADVRRGRRLGVDAYVTKPFDPEQLISTVRRLACQPAGSVPEA